MVLEHMILGHKSRPKSQKKPSVLEVVKLLQHFLKGDLGWLLSSFQTFFYLITHKAVENLCVTLCHSGKSRHKVTVN